MHPVGIVMSVVGDFIGTNSFIIEEAVVFALDKVDEAAMASRTRSKYMVILVKCRMLKGLNTTEDYLLTR